MVAEFRTIAIEEGCCGSGPSAEPPPGALTSATYSWTVNAITSSRPESANPPAPTVMAWPTWQIGFRACRPCARQRPSLNRTPLIRLGFCPTTSIAVRIHLWSLWIGLSRLLPPLVVSGDSTANALAKALAVSFDQPRWTAPAHTQTSCWWGGAPNLTRTPSWSRRLRGLPPVPRHRPPRESIGHGCWLARFSDWVVQQLLDRQRAWLALGDAGLVAHGISVSNTR